MYSKFCHITSVHPIEDVRIFKKECISLANYGFDVTIIACGENAFEDVKNGVKRISLSIPVSNRFQRMTRRTTAVYQKALELNADVYHFHDPELIPIGLKLKKKGKKVIYDSHEDTAVLIKTRKWIPRIFRDSLSFLYSKYENYGIKKFDAVISVTPLIVEKFKNLNKNTYQITNYPSIGSSLFTENIERENIAFAGTINPAYLLENVIAALSEVDGANLFLAGKETSKDYLKELKALEGWEKVNYLGKIPHEEVGQLYNKSLIGIACLGYIANVGFKQGSLGVLKLFEYMNAGMAVICTDSVLWKEIIEKYDCGICVNPYNVNEIKNAIQYLVNNPEEAIKMGQNGKRAIEMEYNWQTQEKILIDLYKSI